jgi:hypothetical protein
MIRKSRSKKQNSSKKSKKKRNLARSIELLREIAPRFKEGRKGM